MPVVLAATTCGISATRAQKAAGKSYLKTKGYAEYRKEGLLIEDWPVQFLPVADDLDAEALAQAQDVQIDDSERRVKTRVLRPEHLVALSLRVGRPKDSIRITQFLEENAVNLERLCEIIDRHRLIEMWRAFCLRTGIANPCEVQARQ